MSAVQSKKQPKPAREFFVHRRGKREDAELHGPILDEGDADQAKNSSRRVMHRLGIAPEKIDALLGKQKKK